MLRSAVSRRHASTALARSLRNRADDQAHTSNELRAWCAGAIRRGADFEAVWTHILKYNSLVCGQPRQRAQASHPMVEVALATGERLMYDQSTREFWLGGPLQTSRNSQAP